MRTNFEVGDLVRINNGGKYHGQIGYIIKIDYTLWWPIRVNSGVRVDWPYKQKELIPA